jgi:hypothetical protein
VATTVFLLRRRRYTVEADQVRTVVSDMYRIDKPDLRCEDCPGTASIILRPSQRADTAWFVWSFD